MPRPGHVAGQPALEPPVEVRHHQRTLARQGQRIATGDADPLDQHARVAGAFDHRPGGRRRHGDDVARLILTEPVGVRRRVIRTRCQCRADAGGHRHLGQRHQQAAVGDVVHRRDRAVGNQAAHQIAVLALLDQIDRRRRALFAAADVAQIERLAEPALRLADQQDHLARRLERDRCGFLEIVDHADGSDRRGRQDAAAVGLVVERDVAGHDREVEILAGLADAAHAADELAHDFGPFGIAEIEIVGDRQRPAADGGDVAPALRHRLLAALERIGLAIARRHVGGHRERLRPIVDAYHRRIATGTLHRVAADDVVVLLPHPALRAQVRRRDQRFERIGERHRRRHAIGIDTLLLLGDDERTLVFRRLVAQLLDRQIGHHLAAVLHHEPLGRRGVSDDGEVETPFAENVFRFFFLLRLEHHEHALLALGQHHLVGAHPGFAGRHLVELQRHAEIALGAHLDSRTGQPRRAHILDGDDAALLHDFEAGFEQQLLRERIAHLHGRTFLLGIVVELRRRHRRAVDAVAAGLGAEIDDRHVDARRRRVENLVGLGEAHRHGVDEVVAVVARVEARLSGHRRHAERIAIAADARDHAGHEMPRLRVRRLAERDRVEAGDRPRAHGEHVAQDAADAGGRTLIRLDEARVVVALHLEHAGKPVADVDDAGILARSLDYPGRLGRQGAQMHLRGLVRAMLVPHRREDAELGDGRLAADQLEDALVFVRLEAMFGNEFGGDFGLAGHHYSAERDFICFREISRLRDNASRPVCLGLRRCVIAISRPEAF